MYTATSGSNEKSYVLIYDNTYNKFNYVIPLSTKQISWQRFYLFFAQQTKDIRSTAQFFSNVRMYYYCSMDFQKLRVGRLNTHQKNKII